MTKIFVWIAFVVALILLAKSLFLGFYPDFNTQYYVPQLVLRGINPYAGSGVLYTPQVYPPTMFLLYYPFSIIPLVASSYLYTILSFCCLFVSLYFLSKYFGIKFFSDLNMILMTFVFIFFPVKFTLGMGQINILLLMVLVLCLYFLKEKKYVASGMVLGVSIVLKLFPLLLPLLFLKPLNKKVFYGLIVTIAVSCALVFLLIPQKILFQFFSVIPSFINSWKLDYYNQALSGIIGRSFGFGQIASTLKTSISLLIVIVVIFSIFKNRLTDTYSVALKYGTIIAVNILINTFSWQHHFVWMIIPLYATFFYIRKKKYPKKYYILIIVSFLLMAGNLSNPVVLPIILRSHVFIGGILLLIFDCYLLVKKPSR